MYLRRQRARPSLLVRPKVGRQRRCHRAREQQPQMARRATGSFEELSSRIHPEEAKALPVRSILDKSGGCSPNTVCYRHNSASALRAKSARTHLNASNWLVRRTKFRHPEGDIATLSFDWEATRHVRLVWSCAVA